MSNPKPNKSTSPSQNLDKKSVRLVKDLLEDHHVEDSQLEEGGTLANIDGYIELLDDEDRIEAKVTVQVKHLTNSPQGTDAFYDIPQSLFGYADRMRGELVLFIACDTNNKTFYWKHIDNDFIAKFPSTPTHIQKTMRYHFANDEACNCYNVDATLKEWRRLFSRMIESISDEKKSAERFVQLYRIPFSKISKGFTGIENSYINRLEVHSVLNWVNNSIAEQDSNLCLISGDAGVGKSVIIKDIIDKLDLSGVKCLCIKADSINLLSEKITLEQILDTIHFLKSDQNKVVVIIDQIDALSQYLTNDRYNVNLFVSLINALSSEKDVRVIVSCRKFDLKYDDEIKSISTNAKIIEVGLLTDEDVKSITESIEPNLFDKLDVRTKELLRTAQFLDIFCRICSVTKERCNFSSVTDLYDSYWQLITSPIGNIASVEIETLLFELSSLMLKCETLSPCWTPKGEIQQIADCLASRGAINLVNHQVSFFHQSFYDYVIARSVVSLGINFVEQIESKFQGFEIRSTIKAVLEYVRNHGTAEYINVIRGLLFSNHIRKHIKFLVLSILAFTNNPQKEERRIIQELCQNDEEMLTYFLRAINSDVWFTALKSIVIPYISSLSVKDEICYPIANYLSSASFKYAKIVYGLIDTINSKETKDYLLSIVLRSHNDYREECVIHAFSEYYSNSRNFLFLVNSLQDSLLTNKPFALHKTAEILNTFLENPNEFDKNCSSYELIDVFCKKLSEEYNEDFLHVMNDLFLDIVKRKSTQSYYDLCINTVFNEHMDDYVEKLYLMYKKSFVSSCLKYKNKQRILDLINTNDECAISLALEAISIIPSFYADIIEERLLIPEVIDILLIADTEYYVLQALRNWFIAQSIGKQREYEKFILNYVSRSDFYADKSRSLGLLYPNLWHNKWKLICVTIPEELSSPDVTKCRLELIRRFNHPYKAKKPNHKVAMARVCGGVTSRDNYMRFSPNQWLHSFLHLRDRWIGDRTPVDFRVHASMFEECVSLRPNSFIKLVADIINNDDIRMDYKVSGLLGLIKGNIDSEETWLLAKSIVTTDFAHNNCHDFGKIIEYYIQNHNSHVGEIRELLVNVVKLPYNQKNIYTPKIGSNDLSQEVNEHLTRALNSPQGKAIELLLKMCVIPSQKLFVYKYLNEQRDNLSIDIKVLVLYYIFTKDCYDENLTTELFIKYIGDVGCIGLCINAPIIQRYMYHNPEIVRDYLESLVDNTTAHVLLAQIYFYGLAVSDVYIECKDKLEKILDFNDEKVVADIVRVAMRTYSDSEYHNYSKYYLKRYATDVRESVVHSYCLYSDSLSNDDFNFFMEIFRTIKFNKFIDTSDVLKYIKKVANYYPVESYKFIKDIILHSCDSNMLHSDILDIVHVIYKRLSDEDDSESLAELMDFFENELYMSAHNII